MKKFIIAVTILTIAAPAYSQYYYPRPGPGLRYQGYEANRYTPYPYYPHPQGWPACPPGTEWGYGCVAWAPAPPGMLFGACLKEAHSCFRIPGPIQ